MDWPASSAVTEADLRQTGVGEALGSGEAVAATGVAVGVERLRRRFREG